MATNNKTTNDRYKIEYGDLPPRGGGRRPSTVWSDRLTPVKPGEWARVWNGPYSSVTQTAHSLKSGKYELPEGNWEFAVRKDSELSEQNGKPWGYLWAFVGNNEQV